MKNYFQDDKGKSSSMRIMFAIFIIFTVLAMIVVLYVTVVESNKPESNYIGLASLVTALIGGAVGAFWQKAVQKKHEKSYDININREDFESPILEEDDETDIIR